MDNTLVIYALNVKGEVIYGECTADDYPRVKADVEGRGMSISIIDEIYGDYFKCPVTSDVMIVSASAL